MQLMINGEKKEVKARLVSDLLNELNYSPEKVAVAINSEFVPRSQYNTQLINKNDAIDILSAVQGG